MIKVTYAADYMDPNPIVKLFDTEWEAQDWISAETECRVNHLIEHSPYPVSQKEIEHMYEIEFSLVSYEAAEV